jgi:hypothetical protein
MGFKSQRIIVAVALLLVIASAQAYIDKSFAQPGSVVPSLDLATPQRFMGILTTRGNKEVTVNGTNTIGGATIVARANIETPAGVRATVSVDGRGSLDIEPKTKLTLEIEESGVKVTVAEGCVTLRMKAGATGEINGPNGFNQKTAASQDVSIASCSGISAAPITAADLEGRGSFALCAAAVLAIIAQGESAVVVPAAPRGVLY